MTKLFRDATRRPITLVSAPIGYGKSIAVRDFLQSADCSALYVPFTTSDDRNSAWNKLLVELQRADIAPGLRTILQLLGPDGFEDLGRMALVEEAERLVRTVVIVLDGLDAIKNPHAIDEFTLFANRIPSTVRLVALTQRASGMPIARWRAQTRLAEISADDLRFSDDEALALFTERGVGPSTLEDIHVLNQRAEGWPLGLELLAALSTTPPPTDPLAIGAAADTPTLQTIVRRLLDPYPPELQTFVLSTSVLPRFSADLCRTVLGRDDAGQLLQDVVEANLFVVPLAEAGWYRYRRLFADVLRWELDRRHPGLAAEIHRRAAAWYDEHQDVRRALTHLVEGGRADEAFALASEDIYRPWRTDSLMGADWAEIFSNQWVAEDPGRMLSYATLLGRSGQVQEAKDWIDRAEAQLAHEPTDDSRRGRMLAVKALWHAVHLDARPAVAIGEQARGMLEREPRTRSLLELLLVGLVNSQLALGALEDGERYAGELDRLTSSAAVHDLVVPSMRARIALARGQLARSKDLAMRALHIAETTGLPRHPAVRDAHLALGGVLAERGQLQEAETHLELAASLGDTMAWPAYAADARLVLAETRASREGPAAGLALVADIRASLADYPAGPVLLEALDALEARLRIAAADLDRAEELVTRLPTGLERTLLDVRLALARRDSDAAATAMLGVAPQHRRERIVHRLLAARVADAAGRDPDRDKELLGAARLGWAEGFITVYLDEAPGLVGRLRALMAQSERPRGLDGSLYPLTTTADSPAGAALTTREMEVLRYLRSDLTMQEIAGHLDISLNTAKSHARVLYRKLGVRSRGGAVAAAHRSGLL